MDSNNIRHWRYMESQRKARRKKKIRNRVIILILLVVGGYCVIHFINNPDDVLSYVHTTTTAEADFQESLEKGNLISDTQSINLGTDNFGSDIKIDLSKIKELCASSEAKFVPTYEDLEGLKVKANSYPEYQDNINFFIENIQAYSQNAVNTILLSPEKINYILAEPFEQLHTEQPNPTINVQAGEVPLLLQYDSRWAFHKYGNGCMGSTACGPTCLAMCASGLTGRSVTPPEVSDYAQNNGYYIDGSGTDWMLFSEGVNHFGLISKILPLDENVMKTSLDSGAAIILSLTTGDFTIHGHFIVVTGTSDGKFIVNDPSSIERSNMLWDYDTLAPQIAQIWEIRPV